MPSFLSKLRNRHAAKSEKSGKSSGGGGAAGGAAAVKATGAVPGRGSGQSSSGAPPVRSAAQPAFNTSAGQAARRPSNTPVNSARPPSNPSVPLHELCERCSKFFGEWRALTWLQERRGGQDTTLWPIVRLCTFGQSVQSAPRCHFCKKLVAHLQSRVELRLPRVAEHEDVYVNLKTSKGMIEFLVPKPGKKKPISRDEDFQLVAMYRIRPYENGNATAFDSYITTKQVPLHASENISQAKQWLQCCLTQHAECRKFHNNTVPNPYQRPTRVLEITPGKIRLRCDLKNEPFPYLVLSYMWGTNFKQQLRLEKSNIGAFQKEVPRDRLEASDVYKEAMRVTLALGYKYLWIDSLCIIQDSTPDWEYEAARMAIVYGNATCNLAFLFPPNSPEKPTQRGDPRIWSPCILRPAKGASLPAIYMHEDTTTEFRKEIDNYGKQRDWLVQRSWPLFHRAWTYQEYLLSPRTLLLGHKNLMWHCSHHFYDELLGPIAAPNTTSPPVAAPEPATATTTVTVDPKRGKDRGKSRYFPSTIHEVRAAATQSFSHPSILSFLTDWQNVVNEYRGRNLSFEKDRVIAFAGIATAFSHFSQLTFLAGLWAEIAPAALLWHVEKKPSWLVRLENAIPNGTTVPDSLWTGEIRKDNNGDDAVPIKVKNQDPPSWSWFNIPLYKFYQTKFLLSDDELFVRCKAINSPSLVNWADIYSASLRSFAFPSHNTTTAGKVPDSATHDFYGAQITLVAKILSVRENWAADLSARLGAIQQRSSSAADGTINWDPVLEYYSDNVSTSAAAAAASPPKSAVYALISETQVVRCAGKNTVQRRFAGLMLVPAEQQGQKGCWKRIGAWKLRLNVVGVSVEAGNIEAVARRWRERSLVEGKWRDGVVTLV